LAVLGLKNLPKVCPECKGAYLRSTGTGIEKLESETARLYPHANIHRYERETKVFPKNADIIIATQAVFRRHESWSVPLVAVLNFDSQDDVLNFSVEIYDKENQHNKIQTIKNGNEISNLNPFTKPGAYVLDVDVKNRVGEVENFQFEFIFDNLKPNAPIIPLDLDSSTTSINVLGNGGFAKTIIAQNAEGTNLGGVDVLADGSFDLDLNLVSGLNYVQFYSIGKNGLSSEIVERVIYVRNGILPNIRPNVQSITVDNNDGINRVVSSMTSKRNYYVSGNVGVSNAEVFVNGNPTQADNTGKFGAFILLNEGNNDIEVVSGETKTLAQSVNYVNPRFRFLSFDAKRIVDVNSVLISGRANFEVPFNVYKNGEFEETQVADSNGDFSFVLYGLKEGKNYIYLEGLNGESISEFVYFDTSAAQIEILSHNEMNFDDVFVFKVEDDLGVDVNSIEVSLNGDFFSNSLLEIQDDIYVLDLEGIGEGNFDYEINVNNLAGMSSNVSGSFNVNSDNTLISAVYFNDGVVVGNYIFTDKDTIQLNLVPSKNIAFKSIQLDGAHQIDYRINLDSQVVLNLELEGTRGVLDLSFVDSALGNTYTQSFKYFVLSKPSVNLDFVESSFIGSNGKIKISGNVESGFFDWSSFSIGDAPVLRIGDYFEAYVTPSQSGLNVVGNDFLSNQVGNVQVSGFGLDSSTTSIELESISQKSFVGTLTDDTAKILNFAQSYDGRFGKTYLSHNFELASDQRNGLRSLNLKGVEDSSNKFIVNSIVSIDNLKPKIYFYDGSLIVDGTLSAVSSVKIADAEQGLGNDCPTGKKVSSNCREFPLPLSGLVIVVEDASGNVMTRTYSGIVDDEILNNQDLKVYVNGNDAKTSNSDSFVQGQIISSTPITSVKVNGLSCSFDDYNFVCPISLVNGQNNFNVVVSNEGGMSVTESFSTELITTPINVDLLNVIGSTTYKISEEYYTNYVTDLDFTGDVDKSSLVKLIVNGKEILADEQDGEFTMVDVALDSFVQGKEDVELEVYMSAEDELGNIGFSDRIKIIYNRVFETLIDVIVR